MLTRLDLVLTENDRKILELFKMLTRLEQVLTENDRKILELFDRGYSLRQISLLTGISSHSISHRWHELRKLTGAQDQSELIYWAKRQGLLP